MLNLVLQFYLQGLLISFIVVAAVSGLYLLAYLGSSKKISKSIKQNRIFDVILIDILTIPVLSFAVVALLAILKSRNL